MTKPLGREDLLRAPLLKRERVDLEDGYVFVRELTGRGMLRYRSQILEFQKNGAEATPEQTLELMALLISMTVCDESGTLLLTEEDAVALSDNSVPLLEKLAEAAMMVCGISERVIEEAKKSLPKGPISSTTDSHTS